MRCPKCKLPTFLKLSRNTYGCGTCGYMEKKFCNKSMTDGTCKHCGRRGTLRQSGSRVICSYCKKERV